MKDNKLLTQCSKMKICLFKITPIYIQRIFIGLVESRIYVKENIYKRVAEEFCKFCKNNVVFGLGIKTCLS